MKLKKIKSRINDYIYWHFDYDRKVERKIKRNIALWHKGGAVNKTLAKLRWYRQQQKYGCSFSPFITVGSGLRIEHCMGTTIGKTAILGNNVRIYQGVNVISKVTGDQERLDSHERRHAQIGNDVVLGACCTIIGPVSIGDGSIIGACAIVTHDVPPNSVVTGTNRVRPKREDQVAPDYKHTKYNA